MDARYGIAAATTDVVALAREQAAKCTERLAKFDRVDELFGRKQGWEDERAHLELGRRFETFCLEFWERQVDQPFNAHLFADDGGENEDPGTDEKAPRTGSQHDDTGSADRSDED